MKAILEKSRYLAIVGIVSLLVAALAAFGWGTLKTVHAVILVIESLGTDTAITIEFIEIVDSFLIATAILIFAVSLYELFIGDLDLPDWMLAHNLYELKAKLSSMVVLVMGVKFLQKLVDYKDTADLLRVGLSIAAVSAVLIAFGYFGKKE
ncbi:MAG: YqhA family protein [Chloroflexi bacterium]|nr:YqhA family protein [Chloroflexota bacterium]